jgi:hypothetical protein
MELYSIDYAQSFLTILLPAIIVAVYYGYRLRRNRRK